MTKKLKPQQAPAQPAPRVLELDDAGRAAARRHIAEGGHGSKLMGMVDQLAWQDTPARVRAPYLDRKAS